ncbi:MAG: hypothetical protein EOP84_24920, partial [Verrucomicrobiaceae bacterium]
LSLYNENGDLQETVTVAPQLPGMSEGRFPDGAAGASAIFTFGHNATPGASNVRVTNYSGPVLNELLVVNRFGELAPWNERAPWVELYNPTSAEFDLSGYGLNAYGTHFLDVPFQSYVFRFPNGTKIPAQGYKTVWLEEAPTGASVPADTLMTRIVPVGPTRGSLYLLDAGNRVVDSLEWGHQVADLSIGRSAGAWKLLASRTRNGVNSSPAVLGTTSSLKLNEWLAAPGSGFQGDFVEIYNGADQPVEISGLYLTDDPSTPGLTKTQVIPLSYIGAKGWAHFYAAESVSPAFDATIDFNLGASGESLRLSGSDLLLLDTVSFGLQTTGFSQGRILDGEGIAFGLTPTPGAHNILLPAPVFAEHPTGRTVNAGTNVSFSVSVTGSAPLSFQWLFEGSPIPGATSSTLNITGITPAHDGRYACQVGNSAGTVVSNSAQLIVKSSFADWRSHHFNTTEQGNNAISGGNADPDGDGISNLQEFFHGLHPRNPASSLDREA